MRRLEDGDTASSVLAEFLRVLDGLDLGVKAVYLDRGFYDSKCLTLLQAHNYAYVVPIIWWGEAIQQELSEGWSRVIQHDLTGKLDGHSWTVEFPVYIDCTYLNGKYDKTVETAADITTAKKDDGSGYKNPEPFPALEPVERDVDEVQNAQAMDLQSLRYVAEVFAPQSGPGSINHAAVIDAMEQKLENGELVSISLVDSSGGVIESFLNGHQVLAYGSVERTTQGGLEIVNIPIYDPNFASSWYEIYASSTKTLSFTRSGPDDEFSASYLTYDRAIVLYENDPEYDLEFFDGGNEGDGYQTALSQGLSDFISVGVKSPVTLDVTAPDGTPVPR